jgi:hypothetical protein
MNTNRTAEPAEQLALLASPEVPLQFHLNERTRRLGLAGVASAKALLAEQAARREARGEGRRHPLRAAA